MLDFNRKNKNNFWHSPLILMALFFILVLFLFNMINLVQKERETSKKKELVLAQIETLRNREASLSSNIDKLKTPEGIEETIRDKYQVVKEGEKMVVIVDPETKNESIQPEVVTDHSFWGWLKKIFLKK